VAWQRHLENVNKVHGRGLLCCALLVCHICVDCL